MSSHKHQTHLAHTQTKGVNHNMDQKTEDRQNKVYDLQFTMHVPKKE